MPKRQLTEAQRRRGKRLAQILRERRVDQGLSTEQLARAANLSVETVRSIEGGRIVSPGFLTVSDLASVLRLRLDEIARQANPADEGSITS